MDFTHATRGPFTRQRAAGIAVVVMVHLALVGSLLQMERQKVFTPELPPLQLQLLKPPPSLPVDLPPVQTRLRPPPPPSLPMPSIVIAEPAAPIAPVAVTMPAARPAAPVASAVPTSFTASTRPGGISGMAIGDIGTAGMVRAKMDMNRSPDSCHNPAFPPTEDRDAYGVAAISLLIGPDGGVRGSRIDASSGHPQLDQATIDAFVRCTYIRGTIRGLPAPTWYRIKWLWFLPRSQRGDGRGRPRFRVMRRRDLFDRAVAPQSPLRSGPHH